MPNFKTDAILWYNVGVWGQLGYGVPNVGNDPVSVNQGILYLVDVTGRNLSAIMHHADVDLRTPPSINTLTRVHKLCIRARSILAGRAVPPATPDMESTHATPASQDHIIYPVPFFLARNRWLKEWAGLILAAMCEAVQHTENRKPYEISTTFSGLFGQYIHRVYKLMATELFGVKPEDAEKLDFTLSDEQLKTYDPSKWFTGTELIDVPPPVADLPTEDDLLPLTRGIPATQLINLQRWPSGSNFGVSDPSEQSPGTSAAAASTGSFAPAPGP